MRRAGRLALAVALVVTSRRAYAESSELPLELDWQAPPECYTAQMIRAELSRIAHVRPGRAPAKLDVHGRIERVDEQYRLSLSVERNGDVLERQLASRECRALGREVTLVLALAFGEGVELVAEDPSAPEGDHEAAPPERPPTPRSQPELGAAASNARVSAAEDPAEKRGLKARVFLGGGVLLRALPAVAGHAFVGAELGWRRAWLAPQLDLLPGVASALERGVDARYDGFGGALALCGGEPALATLLAVCATGGAMAVRGRSWGATESGSAVAPWYTAGAAVSASWPDRGLIGVRVGAALLVSLNQPRFVVEGLGQAHQIPRLVPSFTSSLLLRL